MLDGSPSSEFEKMRLRWMYTLAKNHGFRCGLGVKPLIIGRFGLLAVPELHWGLSGSVSNPDCSHVTWNCC